MASDLRVQNRPAVATQARAFAPARRASFGDVVSRRTPLPPREAAEALGRAWQDVLGEPPPPGAVGVLWAQWALETGRGRAMVGFNFGNIKGAGPGGKSTVMATREGFGATEHGVRARFRAYDGVDEGARDYVRTLSDHYPGAITAARQGNAPAFVDALVRGRYFTADPVAYRRGVVGLAREFQRVGPASRGVLSVDQPNQAQLGVIEAFAQAIARRGG